ncbi:uncharacterized protein LOC101862595 [Aplysia californica]|uniref:Uncharacterized protein LOC101862595 n=1 Tax=Aplysia californica TaxID=6500 RepID=A0ABM0JVA0_APLCA|nr:uncharacterized protein LOC101862595 [Aplysia californica]
MEGQKLGYHFGTLWSSEQISLMVKTSEWTSGSNLVCNIIKIVVHNMPEGTLSKQCTMHPPAIERLVEGAVFSTFAEFTELFDKYKSDTNSVFVSKHATKVSSANKRVMTAEKKYRDEWVYRSIQFQCKHFGDYESQSKGSRPNQATFKMGCRAKLRLFAKKENNGLVLTEVHLEHSNHPGIQSVHDALFIPS